MLNANRPTAPMGVTMVFNQAQRSPSAVSISIPAMVPRVPTRSSLAMSPVIVATESSQLPNPMGAKIPQMALPMDARMESSMISASCNPQVYEDRNQMSTVANRTIVNAFFTNPHPLWSVAIPTLTAEGAW